MYAVRLPAAQLSVVTEHSNTWIQGATFFTAPAGLSSVPIFAQAVITTGHVQTDGTASVNLSQPLFRVEDYVAQDRDFSPLYVDDPMQLTETVRQGLQQGTIDSLFLILQLPLTTPGPNSEAPQIGLDGFIEGLIEDNDDTPALGLSYISEDGGATLIPAANFISRHTTAVGDFNIMFALILSEWPRPSPSSP